MSLRIAMAAACPFPVPQGSQVFLRENALALAQRGHAVHLVVYGHGVGRDRSGLTIHRCRRLPGDTRVAAGPSWIKPFLDLSLVFTLRRVVERERIDVVFAHNYEALLAALLAGRRPIIYHAHNAMSDELPYYFRNHDLAESIGRWLDRTFPKRADRIVAPHQRLAGHLVVRGCAHGKISVVPPPIDANGFEPAIVGQGLPPVLYTGNLDAYQNIGLLLEAMKRVRKQEPAARLRVATAAPGAVIEGAEMVPTPGFDALHKVLAEDSVLAAPRVSWSGYPIKLLNAMAAGKAIVACRSAAYPLHDGVNGIIVPDNDPQAFADALLRCMREPKLRAELGRNARKTIVEHHHPERVAEALEQIARDLLGTNSGKA